jgi:integrase/recombinase XerD
MEAVTLAAAEVCDRQIRLIRTKTNRPRTLDWRTPGGDAGIVLDATVPPFLNAYGRPYRNFASNVNQITRRLMAEDPAFKPFRVHDLRHRFAILWLRNGGDIYRLSLHLGHSSVRVTENYLGHLTAREQAVAQGRNAYREAARAEAYDQRAHPAG